MTIFLITCYVPGALLSAFMLYQEKTGNAAVIDTIKYPSGL